MNDPNPYLVEQHFLESWYRMEKYYADILKHPKWHWLQPLLDLIHVMRTKGYDKHLRAGKSMYYFIVSRAYEEGLRLHHSRVNIEPRPDGTMFIRCRFGSIRTEHHFDQIEWNDELQGFLDRLVEEPVS